MRRCGSEFPQVFAGAVARVSAAIRAMRAEETNETSLKNPVAALRDSSCDSADAGKIPFSNSKLPANERTNERISQRLTLFHPQDPPAVQRARAIAITRLDIDEERVCISVFDNKTDTIFENIRRTTFRVVASA